MLRAELALCDRWGIPHSHLLGGPRRWSDLDREKALAYAQLQHVTCDCGTRMEEWDPAQGGHRFAYVGDSWRCPGCELLDAEREGHADVKGVKHALRRNPELAGDDG